MRAKWGIFLADTAGFDVTPAWRVYRGQVTEVQGRLGDFRVTLRPGDAPESRELQADQVVIMSQHGTSPVHRRTGCHLLVAPGASEIDQLAEHVRDLIGDFLKTVHVSYQPHVCAGGTANQQPCGLCIPACPYEAIGRDVLNPLRMQVDHLACEGCGACTSVCPTSALRFTDPSPQELYTRLTALLRPSRESAMQRATWCCSTVVSKAGACSTKPAGERCHIRRWCCRSKCLVYAMFLMP